MSDLQGLRVVVAGRGVFGLATACALAQQHADVRLFDGSPIHASASFVAAGMIGAISECLEDATSAAHSNVLSKARDLWPSFLDELGCDRSAIDRSGALLLAGDEMGLEAILSILRRIGAEGQVISSAELQKVHPTLRFQRTEAVFVAGDWRVDPRLMISRLNCTLVELGARVYRHDLRLSHRGLTRDDGVRVSADVCVIATGFRARGFAGLLPELAALSPIKGHILRCLGGPRVGPVVRGGGCYIAPQPRGAMCGGTMEFGRDDSLIDVEIARRLTLAGAALFPSLMGDSVVALTGVRAATPDGLPLVGQSSMPGVLLATGARRNGWLMAPLVAATIVAEIKGEDGPRPIGKMLSATRFQEREHSRLESD